MIRAKKALRKSLGQNFLTSTQTVLDIVRAGEVSSSDVVLEIGPGRGFLTEKLLMHAKKVIAIEKDRDLVIFLKERFKSEIKNGKLELLEDDIRNFVPLSCNSFEPEGSQMLHAEALSRSGLNGLEAQSWKLIANIPYYITGEIFRQFLESEHQPSLIVLMIQREVGERIMARNSKESLLSLSVKAYGEPKIVRKVGRGSFNPAPNVDSVVISIGHISKKRFKNVSEDVFFKLIHLGFAHKRKQLIGNLRNNFPKMALEMAFSDLKLGAKVRAEDISLETWLSLAKKLTNIPS